MRSVEPGIILENQFLGVLDPAFSARLEGSSRTAAMPRFPDLPGWSVAVDYQVVSNRP